MIRINITIDTFNRDVTIIPDNDSYFKILKMNKSEIAEILELAKKEIESLMIIYKNVGDGKWFIEYPLQD